MQEFIIDFKIHIIYSYRKKLYDPYRNLSNNEIEELAYTKLSLPYFTSMDGLTRNEELPQNNEKTDVMQLNSFTYVIVLPCSPTIISLHRRKRITTVFF